METMRTLTYTAQAGDEGRAVSKIARGKIGVSARQLARVKARNGVFANGAPVHADYRVKAGDVITVTLPEDPAPIVSAQAEEIDVVFEDGDYLVVNKPAPLATQSSRKQPDNTLENRFVYRCRAQSGCVFRPVNRLDKGTSGLMVIAKNPHAQMLLSRQLHTSEFTREYLAVTQGVPACPEGIISAPIEKAPGATVKRVVDAVNGRPAVTRYRVIDKRNGLALVRLQLETGRTHQIRVHLSSIGCPVFGDFLYGTEEPEKMPRRFALHSARICFRHPFTGAEMTFDSILPPEIARLME